MRQQPVKITRIYDFLENSKARINILRGGTGSSKSYSLSQFFIINKLCKENNKTFVIARKTLPALKKTAYKETMDLIRAWKIPHSLNKTDLELHVKDNICYFMSVDEPDKIASLQTDDVWLEEMIDFNFEDFHQFNMRMNGQLYGSFNPIDSLHWIKTLIIDSGNYDVAEDVSTYRDNPYLAETRRKEIENLINVDENYYNVYNLGAWGIFKNIIYSGWKSLSNPPDKVKEISYGIDWGFESPCALVKVYWLDGQKVVWEELIYQRGLTTPAFIKLAKEVIPEADRDKEFYAGTDEPSSIQQFYDAGFNIHKAVTDVRDGINYCKAHMIGLIGSNIIKEAQGYKRKEDKNENVLEEPVKFNDHGMDAGRYGTFSIGKKYGSESKVLDFSLR